MYEVRVVGGWKGLVESFYMSTCSLAVKSLYLGIMQWSSRPMLMQ